jgi:hypothetical protein
LEARAAHKIEAAGKIAVLRDTATMKLYHESPEIQPKARNVLLLTLQLVETFMQANAISLPDGHTEITSKIVSFQSDAASTQSEPLHRDEVAAHECLTYAPNLDMNVLARQKPFRSTQPSATNDVESDSSDDDKEGRNRRVEDLGGGAECDDDVVNDTDMWLCPELAAKKTA